MSCEVITLTSVTVVYFGRHAVTQPGGRRRGAHVSPSVIQWKPRQLLAAIKPVDSHKIPIKFFLASLGDSAMSKVIDNVNIVHHRCGTDASVWSPMHPSTL